MHSIRVTFQNGLIICYRPKWRWHKLAWSCFLFIANCIVKMQIKNFFSIKKLSFLQRCAANCKPFHVCFGWYEWSICLSLDFFYRYFQTNDCKKDQTLNLKHQNQLLIMPLIQPFTKWDIVHSTCIISNSFFFFFVAYPGIALRMSTFISIQASKELQFADSRRISKKNVRVNIPKDFWN